MAATYSHTSLCLLLLRLAAMVLRCSCHVANIVQHVLHVRTVNLRLPVCMPVMLLLLYIMCNWGACRNGASTALLARLLLRWAPQAA
jgi:hypothetical protein